MGFSTKELEFQLKKFGRNSKFALSCDYKSKISQNVQKRGFFIKNRWVFQKKVWFSMKLLQGLILPLKAIEEATLLKTFKFCGFYQKTDDF